MNTNLPSLAELARKEEEQKAASVFASKASSSTEAVAEKAAPKRVVAPKAKRPKLALAPAEKPSSESDTVNSARLAFTLPDAMHKQLIEIAHARRLADQPYQISQILREALGNWIGDNPLGR